MTGTVKKLKIEELDPRELVANSYNVNVMSPDNEQKLAESLKRYSEQFQGGFFKPLLVRELDDGSKEVIGGEHRWQAAISLGEQSVPVINLGKLDDKTAKEISLVDNGRYGNDDALRLTDLLGELGDADELLSFMPYDSADMEKLFASVQIDLDDLEMGDDETKPPPTPPAKTRQEFQMMHFKVPIDDVAKVQDAINRVMKTQKLDKGDSLLNAGVALVHLVTTA